MHNPEITDTAGSGNVPRTNYRLIAALAAQRGEIDTSSEARDKFVEEHGMPGFSPTQGHVASAMPFMGHALEDLQAGDYQYSMFLAKGQPVPGSHDPHVRRRVLCNGSKLRRGLSRSQLAY